MSCGKVYFLTKVSVSGIQLVVVSATLIVHKEEPCTHVVRVGADPNVPSLLQILGKHHCKKCDWDCVYSEAIMLSARAKCTLQKCHVCLRATIGTVVSMTGMS